ncbi:MAG: quinone oxidoreductase [Alphaproteobacteria bacterium]|nr:quinone oxidoreductase [Alphaproteobacteria bacterium]
MTRAIRIHAHGGPELMKIEDVTVPAPGAGEIRVRHTAIGLNFIDTYQRTGLYPLTLPSGLGLEAAGVVEAVGPGVADLKIGERIAYGSGPIGAYAGERVMPADKVVRIPDGIDDRRAAAMMLKGMTVEYLLRRTYAVQPGDTILFHAAAGGVGLIACQWAKALGATVIGTVSTPEKAALAKAHGCDHPLVTKGLDFVAKVKEITGGRGCPVVYDSIGRDAYLGSLDCLRPRGLLVLFGNSSGPVDALNTGLLAAKGSLYVTRPSLAWYTATREEFVTCANALFDVVRSGKVRIEINQTYPLADVAQAHRDLEGRKTTGSTVLLP